MVAKKLCVLNISSRGGELCKTEKKQRLRSSNDFVNLGVELQRVGCICNENAALWD